MTFKGMIVATAAPISFMAAAVPVSATTITDAHASIFALAHGDPSAIDVPSADAAMADDRQETSASFIAIANERQGIIAPLTFIVRSGDETVAIKDGTSTVSFAYGREMLARQRTAGALNADVSGASILPEAATWAMMLIGFAMVGFGMRYGIRRSNAKFDRKMQRIAAGLEA